MGMYPPANDWADAGGSVPMGMYPPANEALKDVVLIFLAHIAYLGI